MRYLTTKTVSIALTILAAFGLGWAGARASAPEAAVAHPVRVTDTELPFVSPLVGVAFPSSSSFPELARVQADVQTIISAAKEKGSASEVGVYFRIPSTAHSFGIDADAGFYPGSLLKVPIMIAYLKQAEAKPSVLSRKYAYIPSEIANPLPNTLSPQLRPGTHTVDQLIRAMIETSDNSSKDILMDHVDERILQDVFDEMDVNFLKDPVGLVSPRQYVTFFSRLYNAAFLSRENSNRALELLTHATFTDGLTAKLPRGVKVAHKYGERGVYVDGSLIAIELHDCGIIYADTEPYYLCVMTRGKDINSVGKVISDISAKVYADRASFAPAQ